MNETRSQVKLRLLDSLVDDVKKVAKLRHTSRTAIHEAALKVYLSQTEHQAVIDRRLNKLQRQNENLAQDVQLLLETVATFFKVYLGHTPEIPLAQKKIMEEGSVERFKNSVRFISRALKSDRLFSTIINEQIMKERDFPDPEKNNDKQV